MHSIVLNENDIRCHPSLVPDITILCYYTISVLKECNYTKVLMTAVSFMFDFYIRSRNVL